MSKVWEKEEGRRGGGEDKPSCRPINAKTPDARPVVDVEEESRRSRPTSTKEAPDAPPPPPPPPPTLIIAGEEKCRSSATPPGNASVERNEPRSPHDVREDNKTSEKRGRDREADEYATTSSPKETENPVCCQKIGEYARPNPRRFHEYSILFIDTGPY